MVKEVVQVHCQTEDVKTMSRLVRCTMASQVWCYDAKMLRQGGNVTFKDLGRASKTVQLRVVSVVSTVGQTTAYLQELTRIGT